MCCPGFFGFTGPILIPERNYAGTPLNKPKMRLGEMSIHFLPIEKWQSPQIFLSQSGFPAFPSKSVKPGEKHFGWK